MVTFMMPAWAHLWRVFRIAPRRHIWAFFAWPSTAVADRSWHSFLLTVNLRNYFLIVFILVIPPEQIVEGYIAIVNVNPRFAASVGIDAAPNTVTSLALPYGTEIHVLGAAWRFFATLTSPDVPHAVSSDEWIYEA